ncbi:hypothetical protein ANN_16033 [Periplaneta americana]|uniref:Amino acid transporter transmembrane domain-containing protein n=1 Tax=Periplaneta americana TaxID=6978 RepID=A0ABQ8SHZ6_PERAM|nr:hypothetical protein ANN_16033 [Periplaneta americana]
MCMCFIYCIAGGSGRLSAIFLIINAALGAGLLNFPQAFDQAGGIVTAIIVQAFYVTLTLLYMNVCVSSKFDFPAFIFVVVLSSVHGVDFCHYWYMNRSFTVAVTSCAFILPLCYSKRIDFLKYVSSLGVVAVLYIVALIVYQKCMGNFVPGPIKTSPTNWTDVFLVVPVICFGYQCHVSVIPIYACLRERTMANFALCSSVAIFVCVAAYSLTGIFGYLTFGSFVTSDVLESYSGSNAIVLIGIVAIAIKTYTTYPILLFCGREAVSNLWTNLLYSNESDVAIREPRRRVAIATVWFILTLVLALVSPDIGSVINILGSLAAIFIFVFPGLCLMQSAFPLHLNKDKLKLVAGILFILLGTFIFGVVFVQAIIHFYENPIPSIKLCV